MNSKVQIAVIDGGWVMVGNCEAGAKTVTLTNAHVIRVWGTTKGLGEIALNGPTKATVLDKIGVAFIERAQVRFLIACDDSKWKL
jgi:hypothetical protein